jgi:hypothetical protein
MSFVVVEIIIQQQKFQQLQTSMVTTHTSALGDCGVCGLELVPKTTTKKTTPTMAIRNFVR